MLKLIIEDDEGRKTVVPFVREEITIGRQEGNTIRLTERNVSRRHARLLRQNGHVVVEDLGSSNGTRINGERISGQSAIKDGDLIQIGDYDLALQSEAAAAAAAAKTRPPKAADEEDSDPDASASEPETETETPIHEESSSNGANGDQRRHSTAIIHMDAVENTRSRKVKNLGEDEAPRLVVVSAELKGQEFACIRTEMRIGRTDDNDIVIDHRSLSRTHAKLVREDSGEWRVMDMQSANGMKINGESYAQASLASGDIIELGHVKLKFVAAGEAIGSLSAGGRSKAPLIAVMMVVLLGGGAAAFFLLKGGGGGETPKPPEVVTQDPPKPPDQPQVTKPPEPKPPEPDQPKPPDTTAQANAAKDLQARMDAARKALAQGKLDQAEDALNPLKQADGTWPEEVKELVTDIEEEKQVLQALTDAQKAFDAKQLDEADALLARAEITSVFTDRYKQLRASVDAARKTAPKVETPKPPPPQPPRPSAPSTDEQAKTAYEDALNLFRARQQREALILAKKCIELTPKDAKCHKLLGAIYATLQQMDLAADHYREFLKLAPTDPSASKVQEILNNYEKSQK